MSAALRAALATVAVAALWPGPVANAGDEMQDAQRPRQYRPTSISFPDSSGKRFFNQRVLPALASNGCLTCHTPAPGDVHPAIQYEHLLPYLAMGQSPTNNVLMLKLANQRSFNARQPAHVGGQRCSSEEAEPCGTIQAWWQLEFGARR